MSMTTTSPVADYVNRIANANPVEAVQIALAEAERERALATKAQTEYRSLAEVEFDEHGRIVKANLGGLWRLSQMYAGSMMVPEHYRGKPNDCFIACQMAYRLRVDPFAYMQASYVVHGKPGIEAKLAVAMLNTSGKIVGRIRYREERDTKRAMIACEAFAFDRETGEEVSARVTWEMAQAEGWVSKSGSKWKTMPEVMFHYRSATFLIRQYYPEVMMGMRTLDECEDIGDETPAELNPPRTLNDLAARLEGPLAAQEGVVETADVPAPTTHAPESDHTSRPSDTEQPEAGQVPQGIEDAEAGYAACESEEQVRKFSAELRGRNLSNEDASRVWELEAAAKQRIRGGKPKQQKQLAGAR